MTQISVKPSLALVHQTEVTGQLPPQHRRCTRRMAFLQRLARHTRIGQRVGQGQIIHTDQARVPGGAAFKNHATGAQAEAPCRSRRVHER